MGSRRFAPIHDRLWAKVEIGHPLGCWSWIGATDRKGYGVIGLDRRQCRCHRIAYEFFHGKVEDGTIFDHLCKNPSCVNPDHVEVVTNTENVLRGDGLTAKNARKSTCKNGHPYDETWPRGDGRTYRTCSMCRKARGREYMRRKRAQNRS